MIDNPLYENAARAFELLFARVDLLERELAEIKTVLRQPKGAVTRASPDGTVAIRDPNILAQEQATGMRGYAPFTDTVVSNWQSWELTPPPRDQEIEIRRGDGPIERIIPSRVNPAWNIADVYWRR